MLDAELEKVESFYAEREKEMNEHAKRLKEQFNDLGIHRQMFHVSALSFRIKAHVSKTATRSAIIGARKGPYLGQESAFFGSVCVFILVPRQQHEV